MPVHAYAPSSMPGENIFGQSFVPVTDTNCWIYTYAWNPERPLTQAERDGYDRGNGVMADNPPRMIANEISVTSTPTSALPTS